jgi:hypothetical protein
MQIANATGLRLRLVQGIRSVAIVLGACGLALACGERFEPAEPRANEAGSGSTDGGEPSADGGKSSSGASGSNGAGNGGQPSAGGMGGSAGVAGQLAGGAGLGGAEPPRLPISADGLELWYSANEGVTHTGGAVTIWKDLSDHHRNATQTSRSSRPQLGADAFQGKPGLLFDGTDDFLKIPPLPSDFSGGLSMFAVVLPSQPPPSADSPLGCQSYFEAANGPEVDGVHLGDYRGSLLFEVEQSFLNDLEFPLPFSMPHVVSSILREDASLELRRNSSTVGEQSFLFPPVTERAQVYIGRTLYDNCTSYNGVLSELIVFSRALTDEELLEIEAYLQAKWDCCAD